MEIGRREILAASGMLAMGAAARVAAHQEDDPMASSDGYFLSSSNPVANTDQRDVERLAIRMLSRPDIQAARKRAGAEWALATNHVYPAEQMARFKAMLAAWCYKSVLLGVNSDANNPRVLRLYAPAAHWLGNDAPCSKWGGDNPDNAYRIAPVEPGGRYVVHGRRQPNPSRYVAYQWAQTSLPSLTSNSLEQSDMEIAPDGSFTITLDDTPAHGRRNHYQIAPDAQYFMARDSLADWMETPNALRVFRLDRPSRGPLTEDEMAARAIRCMLQDVYFAYWCVRIQRNMPPNTMIAPRFTGTSGLVTQVTSYGGFHIGDDEALIVTTTGANAAYRSIALYDQWNLSPDYRNHQCHLNSAQMAPDADGKFTCVVSLHDPGVHNWVDPVGMHDFFVGLRWQGLPANAHVLPTLDYRIVKFAELGAALPSGVRTVTAAERVAQLNERRRTFDRRFQVG